MSQRSKGQREAGLVGAVEDLATSVGRFGYGLLHLPLQLLPTQTRTHVHNAIRELSYGFASLPRDFADIASEAIEGWAQDDQPDELLSAGPKLPSRGFEVRSTPAERDLGPSQRIGLITLPDAPPMAPLGGGTQLFGASAPSPVPAGLTIQHAGLTIQHIEYDPPGNDIEGEYVLISNAAANAVNMSGWTFHDGDLKHVYTFPSFSLPAGASVKLWTKKGRNDDTNLYWQSGRAIWNNSGDTGTLRLPSGEIVSSYTYKGR
jgi:hypothetical protein